MQFSKRVEFIQRLLHAGATQKLLHGLEKLGPLQSARLLRQFNQHDRLLFLETLLDFPFLDKIILELPEETLPEILGLISDVQLGHVLARLPADFVWAFLQRLSSEKQELFLTTLPVHQREKILRVAQYSKGSCGEAMHTELLVIKDSATVEEAIQLLRQSDPPSKIFYLYVVDDEGHLLGTTPLRALIRENPSTPVSQVMLVNPVAVRSFDPQNRAAQLFSQNKLLAVPVVDESHHLLGVITVDDVVDIIQEQATEEMYHMAGLTKEDRIFAPIMQTTWKRLIWMTINLGTAFLAASVVGLFQESISKVVALAIFMPIVAGMGGNGGTQSLTVITRALALGEIGGHEVWRVLFKQVLVGLMVGFITGLLTGLIAWGWKGNWCLGLVLWLAMIVNMMIAGFAGGIIPITLRTLKLDPALGAGVIVTTFTDVFGFLSFLGLATIFLKYLV